MVYYSAEIKKGGGKKKEGTHGRKSGIPMSQVAESKSGK